MFTPQILLFLVVGIIAVIYLPAIASPKKFRKAMKSFMADHNIVRLLGIFIMLIGFMFLSVQWKFEGSWMIIIPILGWASLLKGLVFVWRPQCMEKAVKKILLKSDTHASAVAVVAIAAAAALVYIAMNLIVLGEVVAG